MRGEGGTAANSALAAGHSRVPESLWSRTWVARGAWPVRGLLARPVLYQVYAARLLLFEYVAKLTRLVEALYPSGKGQAFTNHLHTTDLLRLLHEDISLFCHAVDNSNIELSHGLALLGRERLHLCHLEGPFLHGGRGRFGRQVRGELLLRTVLRHERRT